MIEVKLGSLIAPAPALRLGADRKLPILSMTMHSGLVDQGEKFRKRVASADLSPYKVVRSGQLVVGFPIDEAVLAVQRLHSEGVVSPAYAVWEIDTSAVDDRYLERFLRSPRAISFYKARLQGSTARRRSLPNEVFLDMGVPLPPLPEQRRIASILDRVDAIRGDRRDALLAVKELVEVELESVLRHTDKIVPLGSLVEEFRYGTSVKSGNADTPVLRIPNVSRRVLDLTALKYVQLSKAELQRLTLSTGDLLIVRSNGNREIVGATVCVPHFSEPHVFASYLIRARPLTTTNAAFVAKYLASQRGRTALKAGATTSAGQYNINTQTLAALPIALPSSERQEEFMSTVGRLDTLAALHQKHLQCADELFASLQHRAFRGEL